jgi:hypothetical protein
LTARVYRARFRAGFPQAKSADTTFLFAFFILSLAVKLGLRLTPVDLFMSHFMQSAVTLGGCIGAFTLVVAVIEMFT